MSGSPPLVPPQDCSHPRGFIEFYGVGWCQSCGTYFADGRFVCATGPVRACGNKGKHPLRELHRVEDVRPCVDAVVRWCQCGAFVVDLESDNRLCGHVQEMLFPDYFTKRAAA